MSYLIDCFEVCLQLFQINVTNVYNQQDCIFQILLSQLKYIYFDDYLNFLLNFAFPFIFHSMKIILTTRLQELICIKFSFSILCRLSKHQTIQFSASSSHITDGKGFSTSPHISLDKLLFMWSNFIESVFLNCRCIKAF